MSISKLRGSASRDFTVFLAFLGAVLVFGGGSRADITSLILLRPLAVLVCVYALLRLQLDRVRANLPMLVFAGVLLLYVLVQLIPLPPAMWQALPGRDIVVDMERLVGMPPQSRPFTLSPIAGWNAFYSLFVPLAVLLLGIQLDREERFKLLYTMLGFGALTGLLGMLQMLGPSSSPLYFYNITNNGLAVGLFANRNHQAVYLACLIPMIAVAASLSSTTPARSRLKLWVAGLSLFFLLPLILASASRAGLIVSVIGLASVPFLFKLPADVRVKRARRRELNRWSRIGVIFGGIAAALIALVMIGIIFARSAAFQRLMESETDESRNLMWATTYEAIGTYFPWGSGVASFVEVFRIAEPLKLVSPTYVNHAHNDYLELLLTGGVVSAVLLAIATLWYVKEALRVWLQRDSTRSTTFSRMSTVLIAMLAVASAVDYPLRTPSMAAFIVIAALWLRGDRVDPGGRKGFAKPLASASGSTL